MNTTEGDIFKKSSDGVNFAVKKIVNDMAVFESQDKRRQIKKKAGDCNNKIL